MNLETRYQSQRIKCIVNFVSKFNGTAKNCLIPFVKILVVYSTYTEMLISSAFQETVRLSTYPALKNGVIILEDIKGQDIWNNKYVKVDKNALCK